MAKTQASAPGKVILFGEHAVVYGYPAIAVPVTEVAATARVRDGEEGGVRLVAVDYGRAYRLEEAEEEDALAAAVRLVGEAGEMERLPDVVIEVSSTIPVASGMGSGAAVAAAMIRALVRHLGLVELDNDEAVSRLAYEVERLHHGMPSGIDNTVVSYGRPVYFQRGQPQNRIETLAVGAPLRLLIGDTGIASMTKEVVTDVRRQWQAEPEVFEDFFAGCGRIAEAAREAIEAGERAALGALMDQNQMLLEAMSVSAEGLERLIGAARRAGALGAKLSGAGRGGNMIALVTEEREGAVHQALMAAGARQVLHSVIPQTAKKPAG